MQPAARHPRRCRIPKQGLCRLHAAGSRLHKMPRPAQTARMFPGFVHGQTWQEPPGTGRLLRANQAGSVRKKVEDDDPCSDPERPQGLGGCLGKPVPGGAAGACRAGPAVDGRWRSRRDGRQIAVLARAGESSPLAGCHAYPDGRARSGSLVGLGQGRGLWGRQPPCGPP